MFAFSEEGKCLPSLFIVCLPIASAIQSRTFGKVTDLQKGIFMVFSIKHITRVVAFFGHDGEGKACFYRLGRSSSGCVRASGMKFKPMRFF